MNVCDPGKLTPSRFLNYGDRIIQQVSNVLSWWVTLSLTTDFELYGQQAIRTRFERESFEEEIERL